MEKNGTRSGHYLRVLIVRVVSLPRIGRVGLREVVVVGVLDGAVQPGLRVLGVAVVIIPVIE